jgi:branched-chain amino acid transport system permease protein
MMKRFRTPLLWIGGFFLFAAFVIFNTDFTTFLRYFMLGLPQGAVIALIAVGYSMVYGIIQLINFAHGEVFMFSTYFTLMFLVAPMGPGGTQLLDPNGFPIPPAGTLFGIQLISLCMCALAACAAWSLLDGRVRNTLARLSISAGAGMAAWLMNRALLPMPGAAAVLPFFGAAALGLLYSCCLGVTMDRVAYKPLRNSPRLIPLITAIGISLLLQNVAQAVWGSASRDYPNHLKPEIFTDPKRNKIELFTLAGPSGQAQKILMPLVDVCIIALAVALLLGLVLFVSKTRTGKALRACAQDRVTASLMGVKADRAVALAFALGAILAAMVAPLYVLRGTYLQPTMGYIIGILAFSSAVLGGIGNIAGAMLGGMIIGMIYSFVPIFDTFDRFRMFGWLESAGLLTKETWHNLASGYGRPSQYQLGIAYVFMIIVIIMKPTGLLGKASARRA